MNQERYAANLDQFMKNSKRFKYDHRRMLDEKKDLRKTSKLLGINREDLANLSVNRKATFWLAARMQYGHFHMLFPLD